MDVASEDNFVVVTEEDMAPYYPPITFTANPFFPLAIPSSSGSAGGSNEGAVIASGSTSSGSAAPVAGSSSGSSSTGSAGNTAPNNNSALFRRRRVMKSTSKMRSVAPAVSTYFLFFIVTVKCMFFIMQIMESIWNGVYFDCSLPVSFTAKYLKLCCQFCFVFSYWRAWKLGTTWRKWLSVWMKV